MKNFFNIKDMCISTLITLILAAIVIIARFNYINTILAFIACECLVGYIYRNSILKKKLYLQNKSHFTEQSDEPQKPFNAAYYDLYNNFNFNRVMLLIKAMLVGLSVSSVLLADESDIIKYITGGIVAVASSVIVVCIVIFTAKKENTIMKLLSVRKDTWYGDYTKQELEIIKELGK